MPRRRSTVSLRLVRRAALFVTPAIFLACTGEDVAGPTTGTFEVRTITTGPLPADSYTLMWDGVDHGTVGVAAAVILREVPPGSHTVGLAGVPANCEVKGANPQTVAVPAGQTLTVVFEIACAIVPNAGTLLITTATTGFDLDPNGFFVVMHTVGQLQDVARGIGANDTLVRNNVTAGALRVELSGLADNCAVQGINPREVAVTAEATTEIDFVILCAATTGSVEVSTTTTGSSLDPDGYSVGMSYSTPISIGINDSLTASGLFPNERAVGLSGIAENCAVQNKNPQEVTIVADDRLLHGALSYTGRGALGPATQRHDARPDASVGHLGEQCICGRRRGGELPILLRHDDDPSLRWAGMVHPTHPRGHRVRCVGSVAH